MAEESTARRSERQRGFVLIAVMVGVMWVLEVIDQTTGGSLERYGIEPHDPDGLAGIVTAPFLHAGFGHLIGNTVPFVLLGVLIALSGFARVAAATAIIVLLGGFGTWLIAPSGTDHIGASGLVFGYATYLIARGFFSHTMLHLAGGAAVIVVYGTTLLTGLAPRDGISWQGHLCGGIAGVVAAYVLDRRAPRTPSADDGHRALAG